MTGKMPEAKKPLYTWLNVLLTLVQLCSLNSSLYGIPEHGLTGTIRKELNVIEERIQKTGTGYVFCDVMWMS